MANIMRFDTNTLDSIANRIRNLSSELQQSKNTVSGIASAIDKKSGSDLHLGASSYFSMASMRAGNDDIKSCIRQYSKILGQYSSLLSELSGNIIKVSRLIENTETSLKDTILQAGENSPFTSGENSNSSGGGSKPSEKGKSDSDNLLLDLLDEAGSAGYFLSGLIGMFTNGFNAESILKFLVKGGDSVNKWIKALPKWEKLSRFGQDYANKTYLKKLVGLDKYLANPSKSANTWTAFKSNFSSGFKKGMSSKAGWITAAIGSAFDNYEEFGGQITDRAVVEWAAETATSVTLNVGATALAGAGLAAVGITGAPVLAVGAAGVLIYSGADILWKNTLGNGKSITQSAGSFIGDVYDGAKEGLSEAADWLGDKIDGLTNGWNISALWA